MDEELPWLPKPFSGSNVFLGPEDTLGWSGTYGALNIDPSMNAGMLRTNIVIQRRNTTPIKARKSAGALDIRAREPEAYHTMPPQ